MHTIMQISSQNGITELNIQHENKQSNIANRKHYSHIKPITTSVYRQPI